jgi:hypothetical protein
LITFPVERPEAITMILMHLYAITYDSSGEALYGSRDGCIPLKVTVEVYDLCDKYDLPELRANIEEYIQEALESALPDEESLRIPDDDGSTHGWVWELARLLEDHRDESPKLRALLVRGIRNDIKRITQIMTHDDFRKVMLMFPKLVADLLLADGLNGASIKFRGYSSASRYYWHS